MKATEGKLDSFRLYELAGFDRKPFGLWLALLEQTGEPGKKLVEKVMARLEGQPKQSVEVWLQEARKALGEG
jgi:hypothetical protein